MQVSIGKIKQDVEQKKNLIQKWHEAEAAANATKLNEITDENIHFLIKQSLEMKDLVVRSLELEIERKQADIERLEVMNSKEIWFKL